MESTEHWTCSRCGQPNDVKDRKFCLNCGKERNDDDETTQQQKTKNIKKTLGVTD